MLIGKGEGTGAIKYFNRKDEEKAFPNRFYLLRKRARGMGESPGR